MFNSDEGLNEFEFEQIIRMLKQTIVAMRNNVEDIHKEHAQELLLLKQSKDSEIAHLQNTIDTLRVELASKQT
jgi:predicted RNase H-like nuclease (RuvC/YqgF family)